MTTSGPNTAGNPAARSASGAPAWPGERPIPSNGTPIMSMLVNVTPVVAGGFPRSWSAWPDPGEEDVGRHRRPGRFHADGMEELAPGYRALHSSRGTGSCPGTDSAAASCPYQAVIWPV